MAYTKCAGGLQCIVYGIYQVVTFPLRVINGVINYKISFINAVAGALNTSLNPVFGR